MRSYRHYCGLARALDVIGDRWTLLVVRELLLLEPARYTDLLEGLPGIATNLLADRLRDLEAAGLISRETAPPPVATPLFRLTPRGRALEPVIAALGTWASPFMGEMKPDDEVRGRWCLLPMRLYLADRTPNGPPIVIQANIGGESLCIETTGDATVRTRLGTAVNPDATMSGGPHVAMGLLAGRLTLSQARARGLSFQGDFEAVRRLQPQRGE